MIVEGRAGRTSLPYQRLLAFAFAGLVSRDGCLPFAGSWTTIRCGEGRHPRECRVRNARGKGRWNSDMIHSAGCIVAPATFCRRTSAVPSRPWLRPGGWNLRHCAARGVGARSMPSTVSTVTSKPVPRKDGLTSASSVMTIPVPAWWAFGTMSMPTTRSCYRTWARYADWALGTGWPTSERDGPVLAAAPSSRGTTRHVVPVAARCPTAKKRRAELSTNSPRVEDPERSRAPRAARLAILRCLGAHSCAWAEHPFPAERSRREVFVHCVQ
jgi:hypothetical protein